MEVHMEPHQKEKLDRYFRNADQFMWGVIPGDKRVVFTKVRELLEENGEDPALIPDHKKATYAMATENLLTKLGIEKIITEIVTKQVKRQFDERPGALDFLRAHWMSGTMPRWQTLQSLRASKTLKEKLAERMHPKDIQFIKKTGDILDAFVEVNPQYKYVHGWTVFAGLWFEEIEPLLKEADKHSG
jgi:hypothetical protein